MNEYEDESYNEFNLNFKIEDGVALNQRELVLINYEFAGNEVLCKFDEVDGMNVLTYKIPATLPISQFLRKPLYKSEFLAILASIMKQLLFLEDSRLALKKVLLNTKYMYIDLATMNVQMIYMPIEKEFVDCNVCEFIQTFISKVRFVDMQCVNCVEKILHYLDNSGMFSVRDFYNFVFGLQENDFFTQVDETDIAETAVLTQMQYKKFMPYLVKVKNNELIPIMGEEFTIGKGTACSYSVTDNSRVSRKHCILRLSNGECYIYDNNSTNHTYVNGREVHPGETVMLKNDDIILLADEEFKYWVR